VAELADNFSPQAAHNLASTEFKAPHIGHGLFPLAAADDAGLDIGRSLHGMKQAGKGIVGRSRNERNRRDTFTRDFAGFSSNRPVNLAAGGQLDCIDTTPKFPATIPH
jgi:hypothetical protein